MPGTTDSRAHWSERLAGRLAVVIESGRRAVRVACDGREFLRVGESLESEVTGPPPWRDAAEEAEIRYGPGLVTALALRGRFCLHASAVEWKGEAVLFLGESGAGKSTLAREIGTRRSGWKRLTDDLSPIELDGSRLVLLPAFPQLKLAPEARWSGPEDARIPIRALCALESGGVAAVVRAHPLEARGAAAAIVAHTVAARLFDERLLEEHLAFVALAAPRVRAIRLDYPHRPGSPAEVAAELEARTSATSLRGV